MRGFRKRNGKMLEFESIKHDMVESGKSCASLCLQRYSYYIQDAAKKKSNLNLL